MASRGRTFKREPCHPLRGDDNQPDPALMPLRQFTVGRAATGLSCPGRVGSPAPHTYGLLWLVSSAFVDDVPAAPTPSATVNRRAGLHPLPMPGRSDRTLGLRVADTVPPLGRRPAVARLRLEPR